MHQHPLEQQLQHLGRLRLQRQELQAQEEELTVALRSQMSEHGTKVVRSEQFEAMLIEQERLTIDPAKFKKAVTSGQFLRCVTVGVTAAREFMGEAGLRGISTIARTIQLRVSARAEAHRPASQPAREANHID
ncbi:MAG: hypothetical protein NTV86_00325 [Planctomycetota bacterium]|nr:hypothetical protein [Planctomycetota bacterium]